jgi:hypothetical protein
MSDIIYYLYGRLQIMSTALSLIHTPLIQRQTLMLFCIVFHLLMSHAVVAMALKYSFLLLKCVTVPFISLTLQAVVGLAVLH